MRRLVAIVIGLLLLAGQAGRDSPNRFPFTGYQPEGVDTRGKICRVAGRRGRDNRRSPFWRAHPAGRQRHGGRSGRSRVDRRERAGDRRGWPHWTGLRLRRPDRRGGRRPRAHRSDDRDLHQRCSGGRWIRLVHGLTPGPVVSSATPGRSRRYAGDDLDVRGLRDRVQPERDRKTATPKGNHPTGRSRSGGETTTLGDSSALSIPVPREIDHMSVMFPPLVEVGSTHGYSRTRDRRFLVQVPIRCTTFTGFIHSIGKAAVRVGGGCKATPSQSPLGARSFQALGRLRWVRHARMRSSRGCLSSRPVTAIPSECGASPSRAESSRPMWNQVATREPWGVVRSLAVAWYTPPSSE